MFARIRKAVVAGVGAALTAFLPALLDAFNVLGFQAPAAGQALGVAIVAGVAVGYATFKVRNDGTVNGSEPAGPSAGSGFHPGIGH